MAEIIRPGFRDPSWTDEVECLGNSISLFRRQDGCGALVRITLTDLYVVDGSADIHPRPKHAVFRCPCGVETEYRLSGILVESGLLPTRKDWEDSPEDHK